MLGSCARFLACASGLPVMQFAGSDVQMGWRCNFICPVQVREPSCSCCRESCAQSQTGQQHLQWGRIRQQQQGWWTAGAALA